MNNKEDNISLDELESLLIEGKQKKKKKQLLDIKLGVRLIKNK